MYAPLLAYLIFLFIMWLPLTIQGVLGIAAKRPKEKAKAGKMRILVMVPCKGTDIQLERNLRNATKQDYPNYKAVAIVESKGDPAFKSIKKAGIDFIIADFKCKRCSGKVKNLASAIRRFSNFEYYCILDSDVNAGKGWLSALASKMNEKSGIVTAFPTFKPADNGFWSKAKHIWGFVGFGLMENPKTRFGWGGSLLFRRELLKNGGFEYFSESVSDDIALTKLCKKLGLKLAYAPEALPIVDCKESASSFLEWSNRQTAFSVLGDRKILYIGLVYYWACALLLVSALLLSIFYSAWLALLALPFLLYAARSYQRSDLAGIWTIPICLVLTFVYPYNITKSAFLRQIQWRGRSYQLG